MVLGGVNVSVIAPKLGIPSTGSGRPGLWRSSDLVDRQHHQETGPGKTLKRGGVPQVPGVDLGEGTANPIRGQ